MSYDSYVNKLHDRHKSMIQSIPEVPVRRYIRNYMKRVLNEIVDLNRNLNRNSKGITTKDTLEELNMKIEFNKMIVKSIETYLSPNTVI